MKCLILQARLQHCMNQELLEVFKLDLEKAEEPGIKLPTSVGSSKKQDNSRKTSTSAQSLCVDHNKLWTILQEMGRPDHLTWSSEKPVCRSRSNSLHWTWNNGLAPNWERSTSRLSIVTLLIELMHRVHHAKCWAG